MTMDEYGNKLLKLLKYVKYTIDEKLKIQHFLRGIPSLYKD
jgi:hypothetical protein